MHFHGARLTARVDGMGGLLLLEEQDRSLWDQDQIRLGATFLQKAASGETFTRFHAEAGIAAEHAFAPSFAQTRWKEIADLYAMLDRIAPSPLNAMNRAVAIAECEGPEAGLTFLKAIEPPPWLLGYYLWDAVLGELHRRAGHDEEARCYMERAPASAPTDAEQEILRRRSEEHTSELQSQSNLVCRLLLEKKKKLVVTLRLMPGQCIVAGRRVMF